MKVSQPVAVKLPSYGVLFAESVHAADFRMAERVDSFHKILYVLAGRVACRKPSFSMVSAEAGTVIVVPAGVRHVIEDVVPSTLLLLCFTNEYIDRDPDLPGLWLELAKTRHHGLRLSRPSRHMLEGMWRRAMLETAHSRIGGAVSVRTLAAQIILLLARLPPRVADDNAEQRVAAVSREIEEMFYDAWNLDRAAGRAGLSRRRFSDLFRKQAGVSFKDRIVELRLAHAARLLCTGGHSIMAVMFSCGFNDLSHFYRLFRQRYGAAPKAWLRSQTQTPGSPDRAAAETRRQVFRGPPSQKNPPHPPVRL